MSMRYPSSEDEKFRPSSKISPSLEGTRDSSAGKPSPPHPAVSASLCRLSVISSRPAAVEAIYILPTTEPLSIAPLRYLSLDQSIAGNLFANWVGR